MKSFWEIFAVKYLKNIHKTVKEAFPSHIIAWIKTDPCSKAYTEAYEGSWSNACYTGPEYAELWLKKFSLPEAYSL